MFLLSALLLIFLVTSPVQATPDSDPKTEEVTISATIPDNIPPTTPVLISPANLGYVTTGYVTFVWVEATDSHGIQEYELSLDGSLYIPDIPTNDAETSKFTLDYNPSTTYYTLKVKNLIADGTHTWKIRAKDNFDRGTDSATWSFTVDTQAPNFILSQVGAVPTSISAQDINTVPVNPIELDENSPQLLGNGETNSTVVLVVTIPSDPTQSFTFTTDVNGNWGQQLGILPRDTIMILDFTITDQHGLVSVLNNVPFIIKRTILTFPPTSPTPSPTTSPVPGVSPLPSPPTPPTSPLPSPLITIPLTPPIEIAHEILQEILERLPTPITTLVNKIPASLFSISALLLLLSMGLLALLAMINRFGRNLSPALIWRSLQALRFLPAGKPQGLVYDSQTHQGIPFALVEVKNENGDIIDRVVTDQNGLYRGLVLEPGKYELVVSHPRYHFPTSQVRPHNLTDHEFYQGEVFEVLAKYAARNRLLYLIPIDLLAQPPQKRFQIGPSLEGYQRLNSSLFLPLFIITGILTLIFPVFWNWLVWGSYWVELVFKGKRWLEKPHLTGNTIDTGGQPLANTIVAVVDVASHQFAALTQADQTGAFTAHLPNKKLMLAITKPGYVWVEDETPVTEYPLDATKELQHLVVTLKQA